jgi:hypothetical protein
MRGYELTTNFLVENIGDIENKLNNINTIEVRDADQANIRKYVGFDIFFSPLSQSLNSSCLSISLFSFIHTLFPRQ